MYFSYPQPVTICHHFTQPIINRTPPRSTFPRQFQPPLFPPRPNGNAKKNYKPTQLSRFRTRIARGRARSTFASAHARRNIRAARSGCARPRRRVYNIAAWPVICCRAGGLLPGWRPASGLAACFRAGVLLPGWRPASGPASCCRAGGLLPGWRAAAGLAGCCWAGGLLLGWRAAAGLAGCCWAGGLLPGPILCSLCKLHSCTP